MSFQGMLHSICGSMSLNNIILMLIDFLLVLQVYHPSPLHFSCQLFVAYGPHFATNVIVNGFYALDGTSIKITNAL